MFCRSSGRRAGREAQGRETASASCVAVVRLPVRYELGPIPHGMNRGGEQVEEHRAEGQRTHRVLPKFGPEDDAPNEAPPRVARVPPPGQARTGADPARHERRRPPAHLTSRRRIGVSVLVGTSLVGIALEPLLRGSPGVSAENVANVRATGLITVGSFKVPAHRATRTKGHWADGPLAPPRAPVTSKESPRREWR